MSPQARVQIQAGPPAFLPSNRNQSEAVIGGVATLFVVLVVLNLISRWMIRICRPMNCWWSPVHTATRAIRA